MAYTSKPDGTDTIASSDQVIKANFDFLALAIAQEHGWNTSDSSLTVHASNQYVGVLTRDMQANDGAVAYTGVGFQPDMVLFFAIVRTTTAELVYSLGCHDGTNDKCVYSVHTAAGGHTQQRDESNCIHLVDSNSAAATQVATVTTLGNDGFTLTWDEGAVEPTSTDVANVFYLCLKLV